MASVLPLQPQDWLVTSYRETGAMWMHGVPLKLLSLYWMGNEFGSQMPEGVRVLPISIPVGTHPLHAVGLAWAGNIGRTVAVTYFGDGATSEGDVHEALNIAGVYQLPCIFFCQNNQYAISVPRHTQTASRTIAQKALAYGFPGILVDGNDAFAVYAVMREAVERARRGQGPTLIEAYTYRIGAHTTADDPTKYRDEAELEEWKGRDPLLRLQRYLQHTEQWSEAWEQQMLAECTAEVEQAMEEAAAVPPSPQAMFRYMYAEMTPQLIEQEAALPASLQQQGRAMALRTLVEAINDALRCEMAADDRVILLGEDIGREGGVFRSLKGYRRCTARSSVVDTPLAESALPAWRWAWPSRGYDRWQRCSSWRFHPAFDQITNHLGRMRNRSRGRFTCPLVMRAPYGGGIHPPEHHSESGEAF